MFNIEIDYQGDPRWLGYFTAAAARWERIITGDLPDQALNGRLVDDLLISVSVLYIDGPSNILGQAGPREVRTGGLP
jgi:hypothetical protein